MRLRAVEEESRVDVLAGEPVVMSECQREAQGSARTRASSCREREHRQWRRNSRSMTNEKNRKGTRAVGKRV